MMLIIVYRLSTIAADTAAVVTAVAPVRGFATYFDQSLLSNRFANKKFIVLSSAVSATWL